MKWECRFRLDLFSLAEGAYVAADAILCEYIENSETYAKRSARCQTLTKL